MSTILPPPPTPLPLPTAPPVPVVTVPDPPDALLELAAGSTVKAEIVALLTRGLAQVDTDLGSFQIRTNVALRVGAELDLQLLKSGNQVQLAVRAVDGHTLPGQANAGGGGSGGLGTAGGGNAGPAQANLAQGVLGVGQGDATTGGIQQANVQNPLSTPIRTTGPLLVGTTLNATLVPRPPAGGEVPHSAVAGAPPAQQSAAGSSTAPANAPTTTIVQNILRLDPAGTRVELRLLGIETPSGVQGQPSNPATTGTQANTLSGTVTAFTPSGRPIVETPAGLLSLDTYADVRIGHKLTFALLPPTSPHADANATTASFIDSFLHKKSWPTLEQAMTYLTQQAHDSAAGMPGTPTGSAPNLPIPQANSHLAQNLLSATNALSDGDIRAWLGDLATTLQQDQPDLFHRLSDEFAQLARIATEPKMDDWRTALLPFFTGANMEPLQMHLRGEKQPKGEKKKGEEGSRFIIDLQLSNLGRFQLDGFMKDRGKTKNFDLIIRTDAPLPQRMRYDINQIFTDFAEVAGLRGSVAFQAHAQFVEVPLPAFSHRDGSVVV